MMFGRVFEQGLASYSRREDSVAVPFREWAMYQKANLELPTLGTECCNRVCSRSNILLKTTESTFATYDQKLTSRSSTGPTLARQLAFGRKTEGQASNAKVKRLTRST